MAPAVSAPVSDGDGLSFSGHEQQVRLRSQAIGLELWKRAGALVIQMDAAARRARLAAGGDVKTNTDGADRIFDALRDYVAPEAAYAVYPKVLRFLQFRRTG